MFSGFEYLISWSTANAIADTNLARQNFKTHSKKINHEASVIHKDFKFNRDLFYTCYIFLNSDKVDIFLKCKRSYCIKRCFFVAYGTKTFCPNNPCWQGVVVVKWLRNVYHVMGFVCWKKIQKLAVKFKSVIASLTHKTKAY